MATTLSTSKPPVIYQSPWGEIPGLFYGNASAFVTESPHLLANPDKKILIDANSGDSITSRNFIKYIGQFAYVLKHKYSIGWDDVVCVFAPNSIYTPVIHHGVMSRGAVISPANIAYTSRELSHQLEVSQAKILIVTADLLETAKGALSSNTFVEQVVLFDDIVKEILNESRSEPAVAMPGKTSVHKDAYYCFSSGTTGLSKGVMSSHHNLAANTQQHIICLGEAFGSTSNVYAAVLPMSHIFGVIKYAFIAPYMASTVIVFPKFHFEQFLQKICQYKISTLHVVPPILVLLAKSPLVDKYPDVAVHVKRAFSAAAPLSRELVELVQARLNGVRIVQAYGLTESSPGTHLGTYDESKYVHGSVGWLMAGCEARIVDEDGQDVEFGQRGEIWLRGPNIMRGYLRNPAATAATLTPDGFLRTGDVAVRDKTGQYYIVDRIKELIKSKGLQVAPAELEALLLSHPGVADAAVIGYHVEEEATELPRAFVVLKPKADASEIKTWFDNQVARHKKLWGGIVVLPEIPKSPSGKILRRFLRDRKGDVAIGYNDIKSKI